MGSGVSCIIPCQPPDPCQNLLQEILRFISMLHSRYWDLRNNFGNLPQSRPPQPDPRYGFRSLNGERQQFQDTQQGLRNRLDEWNKNNCGPPPPTAWDWATRETPVADPKPAPNSSPMQITPSEVAATGAAIGTGYIIYRVIRMIPSLFPPLWWTIPENAAIP